MIAFFSFFETKGIRMPHLQGVNRKAIVLFPPTLDDYIAADNPVRFMDAFVDQLDLEELGFHHSVAATEGRPAYHPADLLKLYIYGYLNRIRSSRGLERETHRNVEVMWLLKRLSPDHPVVCPAGNRRASGKTIADFRKIHSNALQQVCREFIELCKALELFGGELVAVDGSKFLAVNARQRNFNLAKLKHRLQELDRRIAAYLDELAQSDAADSDRSRPSPEETQRNLERLRQRQQRYQGYQTELETSGESQLSLTDPDTRLMWTGQQAEVGYNVQIAVDSKHKLIVAHDVTNEATDQAMLSVTPHLGRK